MFPVLIRIGPLTLHTYGLMIALGFLLGLWIARREARRTGLSEDAVSDVGFGALLSGIVGARIVYVLTSPSHFLAHPVDIIKIWEGGLVFYGGVILALPVSLWIAKRKALPVWRTLDAWAPSLPLGHAIGRLGCFCAGCCYGSPAPGLPWAVTFTHPETLAIQGVPLHPSQLYESAAEFLNFCLIYFVFRKRKSFDGQLFWIYVLAYAVIRVIVERFRGDEIRGFVLPGISTSTAISAVMFLVAACFLVFLSRRAKAA